MSYADIFTNPSASITARSSRPRNASAIRDSCKTGDKGSANTRPTNYTAGPAPKTGSSADQNANLLSVKLNENCDDTQSNHSDDVFRDVRYIRNARYYVSDIGCESTKHGILRYIENNGVKLTHVAILKPKTPLSQLRMKINVPLAHASIVERYDLWPQMVQQHRVGSAMF